VIVGVTRAAKWGSRVSSSLDPSLAELGTSGQAIRAHYDLDNRLFSLFLDTSLGYSSGMWRHDDDAVPPSAGTVDTVDSAQERKVDWFAGQLAITGGTRLLDIGCGWGGPLARLVQAHGLVDAVGLTLSPAQAGYARSRGLPGVEIAVESWQAHVPKGRYDTIVSFEAFEHFARDGLSRDRKVAVYSAFFERCAGWLDEGGRLGLQTVCFENTGESAARPGRGPLADFLRTEIFPEATPGHLSEIAVSWEPVFELDLLTSEPRDHARTYRAWLLRLRENRASIEALVGRERYRQFWQYLAATEALFRTREWSVYRIILTKRRRRKT
jgi:cyclopropane-fatty-acyl-phospholipid synthase